MPCLHTAALTMIYAFSHDFIKFMNWLLQSCTFHAPWKKNSCLVGTLVWRSCTLRHNFADHDSFSMQVKTESARTLPEVKDWQAQKPLLLELLLKAPCVHTHSLFLRVYMVDSLCCSLSHKRCRVTPPRLGSQGSEKEVLKAHLVGIL